MKIYVFSDTHGEIDNFIKKVREVGLPDLILFLGDYALDGIEVEKILGVEVIGVKGNNDLGSPYYRDEEVLTLEGFKFYLNHGHRYDVNFDLNNIFYRGEELGVDCILFGHTHRPIHISQDGIDIFNPGSPSRPRGLNKERTFLELELNQKINFKFIKINY